MKYIMFLAKIGKVEQKIPFIFPDIIVHAEVVKYMKYVIKCSCGFEDVEPISAGNFDVVAGVCSGVSESLKLESDVEDASVILAYDYYHGIV